MGKHLCIFGDSITWGADDTEGGGWVARLRHDIENDDSYTEDTIISVYNCGISGDNSDDLIKRFKSECISREPEVIVIAIGVNDSQFIETKDNPRVSPEQYEKNLMQLAEDASEFTKKIAFIGLTQVDETKTTPIPWSPTKHYDSDNVARYDKVLENFCRKNGFPYLRMQDIVPASEMDDGLHPNGRGHQKMFESIKEFLKKQNFIK